jgi:hypothetical protein
MDLTGMAELIFASSLQPSQNPTPQRVIAELESGCCSERSAAAALAAEYGEHPDTAADRMRWALALAHQCESCSALVPATAA